MAQLCKCSRLYRFEASHYERIKEDPCASGNVAAFGKAVMPHGHNYELQVNIFGDVDSQTGMVIELSRLDKEVNEMVGYLDHKNLAEYVGFRILGEPTTQEFIAKEIYKFLYYKIGVPHLHSVHLSEDNGCSQMLIYKENPMKVYYTREFTFNAQHSLLSPSLTAEQNNKAFGKCVRPHGHDYILRATLCGTPNKRTHKLVVEHQFEKIVNELLERFDYSDLNVLPEFSSVLTPTTENLCKVLYDHIHFYIPDLRENQYGSNDVSLAVVEIQETNRNRFSYYGDQVATEPSIP